MFLRKKNTEQAVNEFNQVMKPVSLWDDAWKRLKKNKMALAGLYIVGIYIAVSLFAPLLPLYPYEQQFLDHIYLPPSFKPAGVVMIAQTKASLAKTMAKEKRSEYTQQEKDMLAAMEQDVKTKPIHQRHYILGTDSLGRDVLSRIIYGGRISIAIGLLGTITALIIGVILGAVAGYAGGWIDNALMRFVDIMYGLPYMLIVIIMMAILGRNIFILFIAIALVSWLTVARVVRGQIISLKNSEFVEAARSMGASPNRIIFRHLLPNTLGIIIVYSTLSLPSFIMSESFLSFLGLGVSAPLASWGSLVADGVKSMELYPWLLLVPAIIMTVFLFAMNFLGDGLRDSFDPQSKNKV
ncbi:ABC transporter, permease protein [Treponema lecithinolyticum ATCC 700332]|uniref:Oligopeptide transport system permease protein OppC n=2 Tax=Treponema lecithinolyticum TaxID=53418 RepID=A0ABN0NZ77_TRELE|nr:ABC transporter, permease protein [Treponema lecithinolyticum ATCC 700332]